LILTLALALGLSAAQAGADQIVIGKDDTISELVSGTYGELFPEGTEARRENPVLALDIVSADGSRERLLVPSTESADIESSGVLVYERAADRVYVFWETVINGIHPALYLTSFDGGQWGQLIDFVGAPFARKKSLELVVSRSSGVSLVDEQRQILTLLHVFWAEERPATSEKRYAPILLINGEYSGSTPVYNLGELAAPGFADDGTPVSAGIADALQAQVGTNSRTSVVGFLDAATHRLSTLEIKLLQPTVTILGDKIRAEIIGLGSRVEIPGDVAPVVSALLQEMGGGFHRSVLLYMIEQINGLIAAEEVKSMTTGDLELLADKIRAEIIGLGSRIGAGGLAEGEGFELVELLPSADGAAPGYLVKVTPVSSRVAPEVGGEATMWLSESGRHVLVTWEDERAIYYRESLDDEDGWSEVGILELGNGLGRDDIYRTLAERVRTR
jgi:hypothetical protein